MAEKLPETGLEGELCLPWQMRHRAQHVQPIIDEMRDAERVADLALFHPIGTKQDMIGCDTGTGEDLVPFKPFPIAPFIDCAIGMADDVDP